jgi:hypothetical protein
MFDSIVRTLVPYIVGLVITLAAKVGLDLHPDVTLTQIVTGAVALVYYAVARLLEQAWPGLGRVLLSFGLAARTPVYARPGTKVVQAHVEGGEHWPQAGPDVVTREHDTAPHLSGGAGRCPSLSTKSCWFATIARLKQLGGLVSSTGRDAAWSTPSNRATRAGSSTRRLLARLSLARRSDRSWVGSHRRSNLAV